PTRGDLPEFARTLARGLDDTGVVVATCDDVLGGATMPGAPAPAAVPAGGTGPGTVLRSLPVRAGAETFGRLLFARGAALPDADERTLERAAQTAAPLMLMERQTSVVEQELRAELVEDLLAERAPGWEAFERRAERIDGVDLSRPHSTVVLSATGVSRRDLLDAAAALAARRGGLAGEHAAPSCCCSPTHDAGEAARTVPEELGDSTGGEATAGAAGPAVSARAVRALHRGAARCHRLLHALDRAGSGASLEEFGVLGMLVERTTPEQVQRLLDRALGPVLRYDRAHHASLVDTLERYFVAGQNPPAVARDLGAHVNPVYQRLERIDRILGGRGWREPKGGTGHADGAAVPPRTGGREPSRRAARAVVITDSGGWHGAPPRSEHLGSKVG
ncbi:MAG: helix-turn-helix domain-containing protein, partial [Pseudonocardia sp.]|nr:helix-turn-helix domain-containing protein [Pseudonocardia sp.]